MVHRQDIQAVVNALWARRAEAMTIQHQRVISTTGIKCVGNSVRLHGVPYGPPYVISAIGDPATMLTSLDDDPYVHRYREFTSTYQLGYDVRAVSHLELPGFTALPRLSYARPAGR
jgi:uncharacterized protein YlxW (UPF0749 family)